MMKDKKDALDKLPKQIDKDIDIEAYIRSLNLEDIGTWTKEAQADYVRARLKARKTGKNNPPKSNKDNHWDLF